MTAPSRGAVRRAVHVLAQLGPDALAALIERLDALTPDPEAEPDEDGEGDDDANEDGPPVTGPAECRGIRFIA